MIKITQRLLKPCPGFLRTVWLVFSAVLLSLAVAGVLDRTESLAERSSIVAGAHLPATDGTQSAQFSPKSKVYIPIVQFRYFSSPPSILGIYPTTYWRSNDPRTTLEQEFYPLEAWSGMGLSLAAVFHRFDTSIPPQNQPVYSLLSVLWEAGYTPYVNIYSPVSAAAIANGSIDATIRGWAAQFRNYATEGNGGRWAYLAPMQEMNWTAFPYSCTPADYKLAMAHIRSIFTQEGVPADAVKWVFAPNGETYCSGHTMASYYPGDSKVDVISISAFNYGYHPGNPWPAWRTPAQTFGQGLNEAYALAPSKPIFISQTGTTAYASPGTMNTAAKNEWLRQAYGGLFVYPNLRAIIYYNHHNEFDWPFFTAGEVAYTGYRDGITAGDYAYLPPAVLKTFNLLTGK